MITAYILLFWILVVLSFFKQKCLSALQAVQLVGWVLYVLLYDLIENITFLNSPSSFWYKGKKYSIYHLSQTWQTLKWKEKITFVFISLGPFAIAQRKKTKNVITLRSCKITTIALEVNWEKGPGIPHFFNLIQKWFWKCSESRGDCILHPTGMHHSSQEEGRKQCT